VLRSIATRSAGPDRTSCTLHFRRLPLGMLLLASLGFHRRFHAPPSAAAVGLAPDPLGCGDRACPETRRCAPCERCDRPHALAVPRSCATAPHHLPSRAGTCIRYGISLAEGIFRGAPHTIFESRCSLWQHLLPGLLPKG
jgi:hypothetical protein